MKTSGKTMGHVRRTAPLLLCRIVQGIIMSTSSASGAEVEPRDGVLAGYLTIRHDTVPDAYNAGFSMYVPVWPLVGEYPGNRFQTGLFGTWMFAHNDRKLEGRKMYSDIEGGLGWWRDTRFATTTPKFIMGGVALNFVAWANGPGAGKGRNWSRPRGKYGVAQLSPNLLWPPDGVNLKQGARGELLGYGYMPLPLADAKSRTAGEDIPTGGNCWTLFLNSRNFKGPVAFFLPYFFSRPSLDDPEMAGMFLDSRPSAANRSMAMETQYIPAATATGRDGRTYARIASTSFPCSDDGCSVCVHRVVSYGPKALADDVKAWFEGGDAPSGRAEAEGEWVTTFPGEGHSSWRLFDPRTPKEERSPLDWESLASVDVSDPHSFRYRWNPEHIDMNRSRQTGLVTLPECYRLEEGDDGQKRWVPVKGDDVPDDTGLKDARFAPATRRIHAPYVTPDDEDSCWKSPGPAAGPFQAEVGDGTTVTYYWYRFADQPALLNADMTDEEREKMQRRVEMIHENWRKEDEYLASPTFGKLAEIDPALVVTPPPGLEIGYVPIVTRQGIMTEKDYEFDDLEEAMEFIAECIQYDDIDSLVMATRTSDEGAPPLKANPHIFDMLKERHGRLSYAELTKGQDFPEDATEFSVGGQGEKTGHVRIDFEKKGRRWRLRGIRDCR